MRQACECLFIVSTFHPWKAPFMFHICLWFLGFAFTISMEWNQRSKKNNENNFPSVKSHESWCPGHMKFLKGTCLLAFLKTLNCGRAISSPLLSPAWHMKSLRKLFQSKNIISKCFLRWIWWQSFPTCVKACCDGKGGEKVLTANAGKNNISEGFCGWQPRWMMIRKNDFFYSEESKKQNFWKACTWWGARKKRIFKHLPTCIDLCWLIVKDQFFWQFHYFFISKRFYQAVSNASKTIVRILLSVGIHTLSLSSPSVADGKLHQSRVYWFIFWFFLQCVCAKKIKRN